MSNIGKINVAGGYGSMLNTPNVCGANFVSHAGIRARQQPYAQLTQSQSFPWNQSYNKSYKAVVPREVLAKAAVTNATPEVSKTSLLLAKGEELAHKLALETKAEGDDWLRALGMTSLVKPVDESAQTSLGNTMATLGFALGLLGTTYDPRKKVNFLGKAAQEFFSKTQHWANRVSLGNSPKDLPETLLSVPSAQLRVLLMKGAAAVQKAEKDLGHALKQYRRDGEALVRATQGGNPTNFVQELRRKEGGSLSNYQQALINLDEAKENQVLTKATYTAQQLINRAKGSQ